MDVSPFQKILDLLPFIIPLVALQYGLMIWALVALFKAQNPPKLFNKWIWLAIIVLVNLVGSILFLAIGRSQDE
jgi:hypothetical protein